MLKAHMKGVDIIYSPLPDEHPLMERVLMDANVQAAFHNPKVLYGG